jgi:hypothetical protein
MKRMVQIWLAAFGLVCAGIGVAHLLFGSATIVGAGPVNATVDADLRFYALMFAAYGLAFMWCALDITRRGRTANILGLAFFAGGVARLLSWAAVGQPNWFYVLMIPVELVVPIVNYALIRLVAEPQQAARAAAA